MTTQDEVIELLSKLTGTKLPEPFASRQEAFDALQNFLAECKDPQLKVGDMVERNEAGLKRYNLPKPAQAAVVAHIMPTPEFNPDENECHNMVIAVAVSKGLFRFYHVNSAYYQKTTAKATALYQFKKEAGEGPKFDA